MGWRINERVSEYGIVAHCYYMLNDEKWGGNEVKGMCSCVHVFNFEQNWVYLFFEGK